MTVAAVVWSALRTPDDPVGATLRVVAVVAIVVLARRLTARWPWQVPAVVVLVAVTGFLVSDHGLLERWRGPVGYANASAAAVVLVGALAWTTAARAPSRVVRVASAAVGALLLLVPWAIGARAAAFGSLLVVSGLLGPTTRRAHRLRVATMAVIVGLAVVTTIALATTGSIGPVEDRAGQALSERRLTLWGDAVQIWRRAPVVGVGIGGFVEHSPTARADRDALRAHNEYLQLAAETGVVGLLIAVGAGVWAVRSFWRSRPDRGIALAMMAFGGLLLHASIDYVLHAEAVVALGAATLGVAVGVAVGPTRPRAPRPWTKPVRSGGTVLPEEFYSHDARAPRGGARIQVV